MPFRIHDPTDDADYSDAPEVQAMNKPAEYKGFIDIVEYHAYGSRSHRNVEIVPTEEFVFDRRKRGAAPKNSNANSYKDYALVLRRVWDQCGKTPNLVRVDLEIRSERLCQAYREIAVDCYDELDLTAYPIKMKTPFRHLFFHRNAVKALALDEAIDPELRRDVQVLSDFIENNGLMSSIVHDYNKFVPEGKIPDEILWTIFRPNGLVVVDSGGIRECWICRDILTHRTSGSYSWTMVGLRVGNNGYMPGLEMKNYAIPPLGQKLCNIADLPVVPIEYCPDWPEIKEVLLKRSCKLQKMLGPKLDSYSAQMYSGPAWVHDSIQFDTFGESRVSAEQLDERIMVDFQGLRKRAVPPPQGVAEMLRMKRRQDKTKTREAPRGTLLLDVVDPPNYNALPGTVPPLPGQVYPPNPMYQGHPHHQQSRHSRQPGHMYQQGPPKPIMYSADSDESEEWEFMGYDAPRFDSDGNADIMEFKPYGNSQDIKEVVDNHEDDLVGLCKMVEECYNISAEDFELLFPALVPAFGMKNKDWRWVLSDDLQDIKWNTTAFEALQLEGGTKNLIQALVKGHKSKASFDDVVPGKGQGLVFLLHGKPGLGKTLTAESVADYLERPLYTIGGGELSTNAADLEFDLQDIFDRTRRWDAVMLLDEADVLLCKRQSSEMDRNAVVAVFLRKIEYLQGVLFLTTNRRQDFDDAFKSRIHLTVSYPDLSEAAQSAIWKRLIATNKDIQVDDLWVDEAFAALGKLGLNGRTIRNFLRTAVSYAHSRDEALGVRHVLEIIQTELKGEGFNVFNLTAEEHAGLAKTHEALSDLQRLVDSSEGHHR